MYARFALISLLIRCVLTRCPTVGPEYKFERDDKSRPSRSCCELESYTANVTSILDFTSHCLKCTRRFSFFYRVNYDVSRIRREESYSKTATSGTMDPGNYYSHPPPVFLLRNWNISPRVSLPVINFTGKNMKDIYPGKNIL